MKKYKTDFKEEKPYLFLSYSHEDELELQTLIKQLRENKCYYWYDEGIKSGRDWSDFIAERIENCSQFVLLLSSHSIQSENVLDEIYLAKDCKKNFCVICTERVEVNSALKLKLGRIQWINKYDYQSEKEFYEKIFCSITLEVKKQEIDIYSDIFCELEKRYKIEKEIGRGGFGNVFYAVDKKIGNHVVIKHSKVGESYIDRVILNACYKEKRALNLLDSCPYIPKLIDWYQDKEDIYLVENYIEGVSLESIRYNEQTILEVIYSILNILEYLQNKGIVHKDIKPLNLKIDQYGAIFLYDFGNCYITDDLWDNMEIKIGTPGYVAPEQYEEGYINVNFSTDCYSLGRTLQFLLVKEKINASHFLEFYGSIRTVRKDITPKLDAILIKMTSNEQDRRYQTINELKDDLKKCNKILAKQNYKQITELVKEQQEIQTSIMETDISDFLHKNEYQTTDIING